MAALQESLVDVAGVRTLVRSRPGEGTPVVFWHGVPTSSADWLPFISATRLPAFAPDLPSMGRSERPEDARFDHSMDAYGRWASALLDRLGLERCSIVVHDWGGVALLAAIERPERIERLVVFNVVPFGCGYRWHWIARLFWRRRLLGEAFNLLSRFGPATRLVLRQGRSGLRAMPRDHLETWWPHWTPATQRAILALYRSADPERLERAGERLGELRCPALVLWAREDPYIPAVYGRRLAARLPNAELVELERAGHWPWLDRPDVILRTVEFLEA